MLRTALVTGGSKRIGREICLRLASAGINIVMTYFHDKEAAEKTVLELENFNVDVKAIQCDLTNLDDCKKLIDLDVDILINNASIFGVEDISQFDQYAYLHMRAPLYLGMHLGKRMKHRRGGKIVNVIDCIVPQGKAYTKKMLYTATKYGLYGVSQALALELAPEVTVNSICPGLSLPKDENTKKMVSRAPLKRLVDAKELAEDVWHLLNSKSKTGTVITTDCGINIRT